jgi:hypothetical protein
MDSSSRNNNLVNEKMFDVSPVWVGDPDEGYEPVFAYDPLPEDVVDLILHVQLVTPTGIPLKGCVSAPARHFAAVFVGGRAFFFNAWFRPLASTMDELNALVPEARGQIFPLRYQTNYRFAGQPPIAGVFTIPEAKARKD